MSSDNIKISVCVAFCNKSDYIHDLLVSVVSQTYNCWELIICDNGSNQEESSKLKIIIDNLNISNRVKIISTGLIGTYAARWKAYDMAKGDLIITPDADDYYLNNNLFLNLVQLYKEFSFGILQFNSTHNLSTKDKLINYDNLSISLPFSELENFRDVLCNTTLFNTLSNIVFTKKILKSYTLDKNLFLKFSEDAVVVLHLLDNCPNIYIHDKVEYYYRVNENSISRTLTDNYSYLDDAIYVEKLKWSYAKKWNISTYCFDRSILLNVVSHSIFHLAYSNGTYKKKLQHFKLINSRRTIVQAYKSYSIFKLPIKRAIPLFLFKRKLYLILYIYLHIYIHLSYIKKLYCKSFST